MTQQTRVRVTGPDAAGTVRALAGAGVAVDDEAPTAVHVALAAPTLEELEDALADWVDVAREAAARDGDVVTIVADALLDGDDVAGCALGHGLVAATRAYAMERERAGGVANLVAADPDDLGRAIAAVAWLVRDRVPSGDVIRAGARAHGRQRP